MSEEHQDATSKPAPKRRSASPSRASRSAAKKTEPSTPLADTPSEAEASSEEMATGSKPPSPDSGGAARSRPAREAGYMRPKRVWPD